MTETCDEEKQLLEMICFQIQHLKPENIPKKPYNTSSSNGLASTIPPATSAPSSSSAKGKQPATKAKSSVAPQLKQATGRRLPVPPEPHPPLASRVSAYSPALSTNVLVETVKAGMNAQENNVNATPGAGAPGMPGAPGGAQKGKRKVVRVRG